MPIHLPFLAMSRVMVAPVHSSPPSPPRRILPALAVALLALPLAGCRDDAAGPAAPRLDHTADVAAAPTEYTFEALVDTGRDDFDDSEFVGCPAINDAGEVAFRGRRNTGEFGVYRVTGNTLVTIAEDPGRFEFIGFNPSINDLGQVSFAALLHAGGQGVFRGQGGRLTTIARTDRGSFNAFGFNTSINDAGTVAFKAELDSSVRGLFTGDGGGTRVIYLSSASPFQGTFAGPMIDHAGRVAFSESRYSGGPGAFLWNGRVFVTVARSRSDADFVGEPALNDLGVVAFHGHLMGGTGIFKGSRARDLARVVGTFPETAYTSFGDPSVNEDGRVAFSARVEETFEEGIFTGPNVNTDRVVFAGDNIAGRAVSSVIFCREGLNNSGQLAFTALMDDGHSLVVRATPHPG